MPEEHELLPNDGDGKRVKADQTSGSTYDRLYWYGQGLDALAESNMDASTFTNEYVFFGGRRIARRNSSGTVFYYFSDHLGTSRAIVQAGQTTACYDADFYPYGKERMEYTNSCSQNYKFTGKERDGESGLDNFGARYNSSWMGRFMTPDWSETPQAVPYADFSDPQTLNLYSYTRNNPLTWTDPDGHCFPLCTLGGAAVGGLVNLGRVYVQARMEGRQLTREEATGAFVKGAVLGAVVATTGGLGLGLEATTFAGAQANVVGGVLDRTLTGEEAFDLGKMGKDALSGSLAGLTGATTQGVPLIEKAVPSGLAALADAADDFGESEAEKIRRQKQEQKMQEEELREEFKRKCGENNQYCG